MSAFLGGRKLIFEVNAGSASFDHRLHQLERIKVPAKAGFGIGDQWSKPLDAVFAFGMMYLVRPHERLVNAAAKIGHAIGRIQTLVGIHLSGIVGIGSDLPAADINGLQSGVNLLHGLVASHCAERWNIRFVLQKVPKPLCALPSQSVLNVERSS